MMISCIIDTITTFAALWVLYGIFLDVPSLLRKK